MSQLIGDRFFFGVDGAEGATVARVFEVSGHQVVWGWWERVVVAPGFL